MSATRALSWKRHLKNRSDAIWSFRIFPHLSLCGQSTSSATDGFQSRSRIPILRSLHQHRSSSYMLHDHHYLNYYNPLGVVSHVANLALHHLWLWRRKREVFHWELLWQRSDALLHLLPRPKGCSAVTMELLRARLPGVPTRFAVTKWMTSPLSWRESTLGIAPTSETPHYV